MLTHTKRYWHSTTVEEKEVLISKLKKEGLADESIRKYSKVKGLFPIRYWRILVNHTTLTFSELYEDWEKINCKS